MIVVVYDTFLVRGISFSSSAKEISSNHEKKHDNQNTENSNSNQQSEFGGIQRG